jgi:DNA gyrase subunit A
LITFKKQGRGGKGVMGMSSKREDFIKMMTIATNHDTIYFLFSNKGRLFALKNLRDTSIFQNSRVKY